MRLTVREIAARTYKVRDSWWTVLLVDPIAVRIVWLIQPYRYLTPGVFTALAFIFAVAAAGAFLAATPNLVFAGAVAFYISFLFDCVDGKVARLRGGSFVGAWLDFIVDRLRFMLAAGALFVGQYHVSGNPVFLGIGAAVLIFDLFHYVNGAEVTQLRNEMHQALGAAPQDRPRSMPTLARSTPALRAFTTVATRLQRYRIRPRLFSGIEFEQAIGVVAPLSGAILLVADAALVLGVLSEVAIIVLLVRSARNTTRTLMRQGDPPATSIVLPAHRAGTDDPSHEDDPSHDGDPVSTGARPNDHVAVSLPRES